MCRCNSYKTLHQPGVQDDRWGQGHFFFFLFLFLSSRGAAFGSRWASACTCWLVVMMNGDQFCSPLSPGPWGVCVCIFGPVWTDGGADAKDERRRPAGKQRDKMYCFCLGGLDLLMLSSFSGHPLMWSTQERSCLAVVMLGGGGGREIYMLAVVFLHCIYGGTLARYLDTSMFTHGNCNQPDESSLAGVLW